MAGVIQALAKLRVIGIEPKPHDMNSFASECHRYFSSRQVTHAVCSCCCCCAVLPTNFVMISQGPKLNTVGGSPFGQCFWAEGAVRYDRMAVKVGVENLCHPDILVASSARRMARHMSGLSLKKP